MKETENYSPTPWMTERRPMSKAAECDWFYRDVNQKFWYVHGPYGDSDFVADLLIRASGCLDTGNARLIVAAVNSYAKHCGPRAIKCAETDLLGELIYYIEVANNYMPCCEPSKGNGCIDLEGWNELIREFSEILAKVKGRAHV